MTDDLEKQSGEVPDLPTFDISNRPESEVKVEKLDFLEDGWITY